MQEILEYWQDVFKNNTGRDKTLDKLFKSKIYIGNAQDIMENQGFNYATDSLIVDFDETSYNAENTVNFRYVETFIIKVIYVIGRDNTVNKSIDNLKLDNKRGNANIIKDLSNIIFANKTSELFTMINNVNSSNIEVEINESKLTGCILNIETVKHCWRKPL